MKISIVGSGMFGFALAYNITRKHENNNNIQLTACDSNKKLIEHLQKTKTHLYHFKNKKLPNNITFFTDKKQSIEDSDVIVLAVPSQAVRETIKEIKNSLKENVIILNTAKALEIGTAKIFSEVIIEELNNTIQNYSIAKFSGGTFAEDIINEYPLGADIACEKPESLKKLQDIFHSTTLRIYVNTDLRGVEYAGAFKNIIAIFAGIINGLGLPYGSETHMISRAAKEGKEIAIKLGAKMHTFSMDSQCWGNDLWMSCTGKSRNREFGRLIGSGKSSNEALGKLQMEHKLVEGYYGTQVIPKLTKKTGVEAPIFNEIYKIVHKSKDPSDSIEYLMRRTAEKIN